jgi:hypothetical protein
MSFRWSFGLERCRAALVFLVLAITVGPLHGQDRLFVGSGELGAFGRFGERIGAAPSAVYGRFIAGGRFVVSGQTYDISPPVFDTRTGQVVPTPPGRVLEVDPVRPRIFVKDGGQISVWDLERRVSTPLASTLADSFQTTTGAAYAPASDELFLRTRTLPSTVAPPMSVIDVGRAIETRTLTLGDEFTGPWRPTPDGTRLAFVIGQRLVLYDGLSGQELAAQPVTSGDSAPLYDATFERWYYASPAALQVFDRDLALVAAVPFEQPGCLSQLALSLHSHRLYVTTAVGRSGFNSTVPMQLRLRAFDTAAGTLVGDRDILVAAGITPGSGGCFLVGGTAVVTAPGPPRGLASVVSGRRVTLTWVGVGDPTTFVLDVGFSPGSAAFTFVVGASSPITFADVPAGTYFVRVRGLNRFGVSRPSNEVAVTVR